MSKLSDETAPVSSRILLIDNSRNGLLARKSVLVEQGYSVVTCRSYAEANGLLAAGSFQIAVVSNYPITCDSGEDLIVTARSRHPNVRFIVLSGMVDVLGLTEKSTGADAVISKGASEVQHLLRAVNRLLVKPAGVRKPPRSQGSRRVPKSGHG